MEVHDVEVSPPSPDRRARRERRGRRGKSQRPATHLLHFEPLTAGDAGLDIPCDPQGRVGLDALGEKLRNDYFFARTLIGRLFAAPTVCPRTRLRA